MQNETLLSLLWPCVQLGNFQEFGAVKYLNIVTTISILYLNARNMSIHNCFY